MVERDRAANLVAVGERVHHRMRAGLAAVEAGDVSDAGIAVAIGRDIGRLISMRAATGMQPLLRLALRPAGPAAAEEPLALPDLVERDELVGLVRLLDRAGPQIDGRDARLLVKPALGGEADLAGRIGAGEREGELHRPRRRARPRAPGMELYLLERRCRSLAHRCISGSRVGRGARPRRGWSAGSSAGSLRISNSKRHSRGTMLSAVPPCDDAGMDRRVGRREAVIERPLVALAPRHGLEIGDDLGRGLDGVDADMGEAEWLSWPWTWQRMLRLALVGDDRLHQVGSPMMHRRGRPAAWPAPRSAGARRGSRPPRHRSSARWIGVLSLAARNSGTKASATAMKLFMSEAPRA